jgi:hypothetical protein
VWVFAAVAFVVALVTLALAGLAQAAFSGANGRLDSCCKSQAVLRHAR